MGFFAWKFWRGRRKNNQKEKVTPWYGFQPELAHQVVGQQQRQLQTTSHQPDQVKADLLPAPSFGSRSSSNSTVRSLQSHTHTSQSPPRSYATTTARPSSSSQNFNSSIYASSSSSAPPPATAAPPIVRSSSVSSRMTTSTASTTLSSYPLTVATYAFNPTRDDEMPLAVGMPVRIVAPFDDGWAWVVRDDDADSRGMVPCECLEMYTAASPDQERIPWSKGNDDRSLWETVKAQKRDEPGAGPSRRMSIMTVTDVSERSSSLNHSYGSSTSTNTSDVLWLNPKRRPLRIQNPDADN